MQILRNMSSTVTKLQLTAAVWTRTYNWIRLRKKNKYGHTLVCKPQWNMTCCTRLCTQRCPTLLWSQRHSVCGPSICRSTATRSEEKCTDARLKITHCWKIFLYLAVMYSVLCSVFRKECLCWSNIVPTTWSSHVCGIYRVLCGHSRLVQPSNLAKSVKFCQINKQNDVIYWFSESLRVSQKHWNDEHQSLCFCHSVSLSVSHSVNVNSLARAAWREKQHQSGCVSSGAHYFKGIMISEIAGLGTNSPADK